MTRTEELSVYVHESFSICASDEQRISTIPKGVNSSKECNREITQFGGVMLCLCPDGLSKDERSAGLYLIALE